MVFRERGLVDFAELAIRASMALGRADAPTDLALALGDRAQHILVDEFQDTLDTQFELLQKLTAGWEPGDGRTLLFGGRSDAVDLPAREADVGLFLKAREDGIGSIRFEALALTSNFRSRREIVDWVNESFPRILPAEDDIESGAVAYLASVPGGNSGGGVEIHAFPDAEAEADGALDLIRAAADGTTAILVRARSHLAPIVHALQRSGIPFQAVEIDQLGRRPVIEDLMALTFAMLHPKDAYRGWRSRVRPGAGSRWRICIRWREAIRTPRSGICCTCRIPRSPKMARGALGAFFRNWSALKPSGDGDRCGIGSRICGCGWAVRHAPGKPA